MEGQKVSYDIVTERGKQAVQSASRVTDAWIGPDLLK